MIVTRFLDCRHLKLIKKAVEEKLRENNAPSKENEDQQDTSAVLPEKETEKEHVADKGEEGDNAQANLMGLSKNDPILSFISGMEDLRPRPSEKYLKKQEKRRLKEQKQEEQNKLMAEQQNRERDEETVAINKQVEDRHLHVKAVAADGNCLYRAIAEQLALTDPKMASKSAYRVVRRKAAYYLRDHAEDFCSFLEEGVDFDRYCDKVEGSNGISSLLPLSRRMGRSA